MTVEGAGQAVEDSGELAGLRAALLGAIELIQAREWEIYGMWDTPRCLWCHGKKHYGGHTPTCRRQRVLAACLAALNGRP